MASKAGIISAAKRKGNNGAKHSVVEMRSWHSWPVEGYASAAG
jgi:hypothetical protein